MVKKLSASCNLLFLCKPKLCKNRFGALRCLAKMHFCTKCIFAPNLFGAKIDFCNAYILFYKMFSHASVFCNTKNKEQADKWCFYSWSLLQSDRKIKFKNENNQIEKKKEVMQIRLFSLQVSTLFGLFLFIVFYSSLFFVVFFL